MDPSDCQHQQGSLLFSGRVFGGTQKPCTGEYLGETRKGIYVDVLSCEPLFTLSAKVEFGCGRPSLF